MKSVLVLLPIFFLLSSCSSTSAPVDPIIEDTNIHEEVFGSLTTQKLKPEKLESYRQLPEDQALYKPLIGFQLKDNKNGTYSVRFVAAMQSATDSAVWTRCVHNLDGQIAKSKATKNVTAVYEALNNDNNPLYASTVKAEDGTYPYDCYAIYCLLNIPSSFSDYYVDAYITVNEGENQVVSDVGSLNIADSNKQIKYSLTGNNRYVAKVNDLSRESGTLQGNNNLNLFSVDLETGDSISAYYIDEDNLNYIHYGYSNMVRDNPDFEEGFNDDVSIKHAGTYNIYLNDQNQFSFEKKVYFQSPYWWANNSAQGMIEGKHEDEYNHFAMDYLEFSEDNHKYSAFMDISCYNEVQFYRQEFGGNYNYTGFVDFPTDGRNCYTRFRNELGGEWTVFGEDIPEHPDRGFAINELIETQEIHTQVQKTYLEYEGDYSTLTSSIIPNGKTHQSDSLPITVTFNYTAPYGKSVSKYSIVCGKEDDLSDGYQVDGDTTKSLSFYNPYLGRNYYKLVATFTDNTIEESAIHHFDVESQWPRNLTIAGMTNCRDMGGCVLEDGGTFKQGLIYRTSGSGQNGSITSETTREMVNHLGMRTEVNLADSNYKVGLSGTNLVSMSMTPSGGLNHFSRNAELVKDFFELLADSNNYPVFFHCMIGTDRTGLCAILLNGLLGVSLNEIYQDYMFSNFGKIGTQRVISTGSGNHDIKGYIANINSLPGTTFKNKVYNCLLSIGLSRTTLDAVIDNLTEGAQAQGNDNGQVIAPAEELVGNGVSITHQTSSAKVPEYYFALNSTSKSVSYTFNATENYTGQIVAYLGSSSSSTCSANLNTVLSCKLDSASVTINSVTCSSVGFYTSGSTVHYYFIVLGEIAVSIGQHTITITGTSKSVNLGGLYIFH